jgi:phosphoribosylanthranilate isomerase
VLKTLVKVGEINNLSDARYCAGMGVELLGFAFKHPDRKVVSKEEYIAITGWLSGPLLVGEFVDAPDEEILTLDSELKFDYIQTNNMEQCKRLKNLKKKVIYLVDQEEVDSGLEVDYVLVESTVDITKYSGKQEVLLGSGIDASSVVNIIEEGNVSGISLKGGDEKRPGYKDFDELADILEVLQVD